ATATPRTGGGSAQRGAWACGGLPGKPPNPPGPAGGRPGDTPGSGTRTRKSERPTRASNLAARRSAGDKQLENTADAVRRALNAGDGVGARPEQTVEAARMLIDAIDQTGAALGVIERGSTERDD